MSSPLDATARAALRAKAEAAKTKAEETHAPRWYKPFELRSDTDYAEDAEFLAACTPDVILALLAAVERGAEDRWQLTRAKSALENYGRHHPWCEKTLVAGSYPPPCNCGYEQAIRDADPVNVANAVSGANAAARATPTGADHAE